MVVVSARYCVGIVVETYHLQATLDRMTSVAITRLQVDLPSALEATAEPALEQLNHVVHLVEAFAHSVN